LKKYDEQKSGFWLADYRFLIYPEFHAKMKDFILLSLIRQGVSNAAICAKASAKVPKVEELKKGYEQGRKIGAEKSKTLKEMHKDSMQALDWALVYGMHSVINN